MDETKEKEMITIAMPALTLMAVHGNLCLSLRHPWNIGPSRKLVEEFVLTAERRLVETGILDEFDILQIHRTEAEETGEDIWVRDNEALQMLLEMVDVKVPLCIIESWTNDEMRQIEDWAVAFHLWAGDNDIQVPPVPEVLKQYRTN